MVMEFLARVRRVLPGWFEVEARMSDAGAKHVSCIIRNRHQICRHEFSIEKIADDYSMGVMVRLYHSALYTTGRWVAD